MTQRADLLPCSILLLAGGRGQRIGGRDKGLPCDVPRIDAQLIDAMRQSAALHPDKPLMLRHGEHWEPLLCIIPRTLLGTFDGAWQNGERSPGRIMRGLDAQALQCPANDPRLANLNTPELLSQQHGVSECP